MILFISYSDRDYALVEPLVVQLGVLGSAVQYEHKRLDGQIRWQEVFDSIRQADGFIFTVTTRTLASYSRLLEYEYAAALGKPILSVRLMDLNTTLPAYITNVVDFSPQSPETFDGLNQAVANLEPAPLPSPLPSPPDWVSPLSQLRLGVTAHELNRNEQTRVLLNIQEFLERRETYTIAEALLDTFSARDDLDRQIRLHIADTRAHLRPLAVPEKRSIGRTIAISAAVLALLGAGALFAYSRIAPPAPQEIAAAQTTESPLLVAPSLTSTAVPTITNSPSATPQPPTDTAAPTFTATPSQTFAPTTAASTFTATPSQTFAPTDTAAPTFTATPSQTFAPTNTSSPAATGTPVPSPSATIDLAAVLPRTRYIGLTVEDEIAGIRVVEVGETAAAAGVQPGDVVLAVDLQDVADARAFYQELDARNAFARVSLRLWRSGGIVIINMMLGVNDYALSTTPRP